MQCWGVGWRMETWQKHWECCYMNAVEKSWNYVDIVRREEVDIMYIMSRFYAYGERVVRMHGIVLCLLRFFNGAAAGNDLILLNEKSCRITLRWHERCGGGRERKILNEDMKTKSGNILVINETLLQYQICYYL